MLEYLTKSNSISCSLCNPLHLGNCAFSPLSGRSGTVTAQLSTSDNHDIGVLYVVDRLWEGQCCVQAGGCHLHGRLALLRHLTS